MPLITHDLLTVKLISILEGSRLNSFQGDIKRRETEPKGILRCPSTRAAALGGHGDGVAVLHWFHQHRIPLHSCCCF